MSWRLLRLKTTLHHWIVFVLYYYYTFGSKFFLTRTHTSPVPLRDSHNPYFVYTYTFLIPQTIIKSASMRVDPLPTKLLTHSSYQFLWLRRFNPYLLQKQINWSSRQYPNMPTRTMPRPVFLKAVWCFSHQSKGNSHRSLLPLTNSRSPVFHRQATNVLLHDKSWWDVQFQFLLCC